MYSYVYILVLFLMKTTIVNLNNLIQDHCNSNTIAKKKLSKVIFLFILSSLFHT